MLDVFKSSLFETTTLTAAINELPLVPQVIANLGIFDEGGVPTTTVVIEKVGQTLALVPVTPRGSPATPIQGDKRKGAQFIIPRLATSAQVTVDEIQNVRAFGTNDADRGVMQVRDDKLTKMSRTLDLTHEYHRLGAIQGIVLDADGETVLYDLYDEFGVSQASAVAMHLDVAYDTTTLEGTISNTIRSATRSVWNALGGNMPTGWAALCGAAFFDGMAGHGETRSTYLNQQMANSLRETPTPIHQFNYAGVDWIDYHGVGAVEIDTNKAILIPLGIPEMFITRFGPADYIEAANTIGLPKYVKAVPDPSGFDRFIEMESQSNPVHICTRPQALLTLLRTS